MNEQELQELLGCNPVLTFSSYYKYSFGFKASVNGLDIYASIGGNHDDIYRELIENDEKRQLFPLENWNFVIVKRGEEEVFCKTGW